MVRSDKSISSAVPITLLVTLLGLGCTAGIACQAETIPASTAIPVIFTHTLEAGKVKSGESVVARTTQAVFLPGGRILPIGATLSGHVVESNPFIFNSAPYAAQKPSALSVHFDKIAAGGSTMPVTLSLRAISGPVASHEASIPHTGMRPIPRGREPWLAGPSFPPLKARSSLLTATLPDTTASKAYSLD